MASIEASQEESLGIRTTRPVHLRQREDRVGLNVYEVAVEALAGGAVGPDRRGCAQDVAEEISAPDALSHVHGGPLRALRVVCCHKQSLSVAMIPEITLRWGIPCALTA